MCMFFISGALQSESIKHQSMDAAMKMTRKCRWRLEDVEWQDAAKS